MIIEKPGIFYQGPQERMFQFIDRTWNPLAGKCLHGCRNCWAREVVAKAQARIDQGQAGPADNAIVVKYNGVPRADERALRKKFKAGWTVFVCDMLDLFAVDVPEALINRVLDAIEAQPDVNFLLLTKNPKRLVDKVLSHEVPTNCILGATIETDLFHQETTKAPEVMQRLYAMQTLRALNVPHRRFISIEPVQWFSAEFASRILSCRPWAVAVGYDNHPQASGQHYPEPMLQDVEALMEKLSRAGVQVYGKTLREAWDH